LLQRRLFAGILRKNIRKSPAYDEFQGEKARRAGIIRAKKRIPPKNSSERQIEAKLQDIQNYY